MTRRKPPTSNAGLLMILIDRQELAAWSEDANVIDNPGAVNEEELAWARDHLKERKDNAQHQLDRLVAALEDGRGDEITSTKIRIMGCRAIHARAWQQRIENALHQRKADRLTRR